MSYSAIRNATLKHQSLFQVIHFFFTPIRITKEYMTRRKMANSLIADIGDVNREQRKIFYFGIPEHNNMGDIAQTYCTIRWIRDNYPDRVLIKAVTRVTFDSKFRKYIRSIMNDRDIIFFQSGYCTRLMNDDHLMHKEIAKCFPEQRMIVLPQTVKLNDRREIKKTGRIFNAAEKLTFIARDRRSYRYAERFVRPERLECFPDIVTSLIGRVQTSTERKGILLCFRNDGEKFYSDEEIAALKDRLTALGIYVNVADTNSRKNAAEVFDNLEQEVNGIISDFAGYDCIITDRYHGTIFSLIANTPVVVVKTNDHKVTSSVGWFKGRYDRDAVKLARTLDQAYELAADIMKRRVAIKNPDILYREFYETGLKEVVEKI